MASTIRCHAVLVNKGRKKERDRQTGTERQTETNRATEGGGGEREREGTDRQGHRERQTGIESERQTGRERGRQRRQFSTVNTQKTNRHETVIVTLKQRGTFI